MAGLTTSHFNGETTQTNRKGKNTQSIPHHITSAHSAYEVLFRAQTAGTGPALAP
ncbi:unnamed protein product, partial [Pleuronectes platessa]